MPKTDRTLLARLLPQLSLAIALLLFVSQFAAPATAEEITGVQDFSGVVNNTGTISFASSGGRINFVADTTLTGGGDVVLSGSNSRIWFFDRPGRIPITVTNLNNTIRGFGEIDNYGDATHTLLNHHVIRAEGGELTVSPQITLRNAPGGIIEIANDGILRGTGTGVGRITGGTVRGYETSTLTSFTLTETRTVGNLNLGSAIGLIGTLQNDGTLIANGATGLWIRNDATLTGGGEVILNSSDARLTWQRISATDSYTLTNESNTIRGHGRIGVAIGTPASLTNNHLIRAEGGDLNVNGAVAIDNTHGTIEIADGARLTGTGRITGGVVRGYETGVLANLRLQDLTTEGKLILGEEVNFKGELHNRGSLTAGTGHGIWLRGDTTLTGGGEIVLQGDTAYIRWATPDAGNVPLQLTNKDNLIRGYGKFREFSPAAASLTNEHIIRAEGGTLEIDATIALDNTNGILEVAAGAVFRGGTLGGGLLRGDGTFRANILNTGIVNPGMALGTLTIDGNYQQTENGSLLIEIAGRELGNEYDHLIVNNNATLDGTLVFRFLDSFAPAAGDKFDFLYVDGNLSGDWLDIQLENLLPGFEYELAFNAGTYSLIALNDALAVPEPSTMILSAISGVALLGIAVRRRRAVK